MNDIMTKAKERLESQIEALDLQSDAKDRMKRVLEGIFLSQNGRLYLKRDPDFQEYITIAKNEFSGNFDFSIAKRMINEQTGSIEGRNYEFPNLRGISNIVEANKDVIESEIISAQNYRRAQEKPQNNKEDKNEKTPIETYTESAKQAIEEATNIPVYQKQRAYDVMDLLAELPVAKIYAERGDNYSKAIALRHTKSGYGYHILSRMFDEYSGATINRDDTPISAVRLASYVNDHRVELDKEVKKLKARLPAKKETKKFSDDGR